MLNFIFNGLLDMPLWGIALVTLLLTHITIVSVTVFLHRTQAHRALDLHPTISYFFRGWLWLTTGMVTKEWVAIHRKHHAKCETEEDPHSPQTLGIYKVLWEGAELYRDAAKNTETLQRYGHNTPNDWLERNLYTRHNSLGILLMLAIDLLLFGVLGFAVWGIQMLWIPFWAAGVINGIGHYWGYRNYETNDASTNIVPWGIVIGGEELHNNHHAFPSSAKFSSKRWEFDLGWFYLRILSALGLAHVKKVAPTPQRVPGKQVVDVDTLRAVVINRFYIMADFGRYVVLPVLKEELQKADASRRRFLKRARAALLRADVRLDPQDRDRLQYALRISQRLRTVYEYRAQLQTIWNRTTANHDKLLVSLQEWCLQAEASGIKYLQDFARSLRSYSLQTA
jgi:stearoyl-CoA desaturase (delta-9 desaturase)